MNLPSALLLTGVFGAGKSAVAEEMADLLEGSAPPYAAIDLDWLCWSNAQGADHEEHALVVRLTAPLALIEERLSSSPTTGRAEDLARAREWLAAGTGTGLEDALVENVGSLRDTAVRVLELAGWSRG